VVDVGSTAAHDARRRREIFARRASSVELRASCDAFVVRRKRQSEREGDRKTFRKRAIDEGEREKARAMALASARARASTAKANARADVGKRRTRRGMRVRSIATTARESANGSAIGVKQRVLITGSTRGLGLALAKEFLSRGDDVFVTSRDSAKVRATVEELRAIAHAKGGKVAGVAVDVRKAESVEEMAEACVAAFGGVDLWLNNAASNGYEFKNLEDTDPSTLEEIVMTNSLGSLLCTRQAIRTMKKFPGRGHVFNLEGAGSDGSPTRKYAAYGHTKAGMAQLSKSMASELRETGTPIAVHTLSPGMVFTELISSGRDAFGSQGRMFVNALAEPAEVAALTIVDQIKEATASPNAVNKTIAIKLLTPTVAVTKLFKRFVLQENKDRFYQEKE